MELCKPIDLIVETNNLLACAKIDNNTYQELEKIINEYGEIYVKYKSAKIKGNLDRESEYLKKLKVILSKYNKTKSQKKQYIVPDSVEGMLQENLESGNIDEGDCDYLKDIYQFHTVYFNN